MQEDKHLKELLMKWAAEIPSAGFTPGNAKGNIGLYFISPCVTFAETKSAKGIICAFHTGMFCTAGIMFYNACYYTAIAIGYRVAGEVYHTGFSVLYCLLGGDAVEYGV